MSFRMPLAALLLTASSALGAEPLVASIQLAYANTSGADLDGSLLLFDTYYLLLTNPNDEPVTRLELYLPGPYLNQTLSYFHDNLDGTISFGYPFHQSFFIVDRAYDLIQSEGLSRDGGSLAGSYSLVGGDPLIPGGKTYYVARLDVPAGTTGRAIDLGGFRGRAGIGGEVIPIAFPEPSSGVLALMAVAIAARRRAE